MKALIEVPDDLLQQLTIIGEKLKTSRTELVRRALRLFVEQNKPVKTADAFGILKMSRRKADHVLKSIKLEWE